MSDGIFADWQEYMWPPFQILALVRRRRGASVLETCLALPVLISLSMGLVDYGSYFYLKNTIQGAACAGVRAAIPSTATNASVTGTTGLVTTMMNSAGISSSKYSVTLSPSDISTAAAGSQVSVTITANWSTVGTHLLPSSMGGIGSGKQIIGTAVMLKESN